MTLLPNSKWINENRNEISGLRNKDKTINPSLYFDKYTIWNHNNDIPTFENSKNRSYCKIKHMNSFLEMNVPLSGEAYNRFKKRIKSAIRDEFGHDQLEVFTLSTKTRLIINLAKKSVLENSISMHPFYGFPIIPASAIKGVTKHFKNELKAYTEFDLNDISFYDALPYYIAPNSKLSSFFDADILSVHYHDYYAEEGKRFPSDDQDPVPVNFLSIKSGVKFEFIISSSSQKSKEYLVSVRELITLALTTIGIGAKTGSSYGYFNEVGDIKCEK